MGVGMSVLGDWTCANCTLRNDGFARACAACSSPRPWVCECGEMNPRSVDLCRKCGLPQRTFPFMSTTRRARDSSQREAQWSCPKCTLENSQKSESCGACGSARPRLVSRGPELARPGVEIAKVEVQPDLASRSTEGLKCTACGVGLYDNAGGSCEKCGARCPPSGFKPRPFPSSSVPSSPTVPVEVPPGMWNCPSCTFNNVGKNLVCEMCGDPAGALRPIEISDNEADHPRTDGITDTWSCSHCTFLNNNSSQKCEACGRTRNAADPGAVASTSGEPKKGHALYQRQKSVSTESKRKHDEEQARETWLNLVQVCREQRVTFVDNEFRPEERSLYFHPRHSDHPRVAQWLRPQEIDSLDGSVQTIPWTVFRNPRPSDIMQGVLGDCWFLSSLAVLAERPELLMRIVITKEICPEGAYQVRLCKDGNWSIIIVDDYFPCSPHGQFAYSQARRRQLWVPLIEKAMAKLHGCYQALTAGRSVEGLAALTGAPCESINLHAESPQQKEGLSNRTSLSPPRTNVTLPVKFQEKDGLLIVRLAEAFTSQPSQERQQRREGEEEIDEDMIWVKLLSSRTAGFLMGASCGGDTEPQEEPVYNNMGLQTHHAYSVLDVRDVHGLRLVRLRNPWGRFSWTGDWSDQSPLWTPELRTELLVHGAQEGVFWMSFEDFMSVDICKIHDDWVEARVTGVFPPFAGAPATVTKLTVFAPTEIDLCLFQLGTRGVDHQRRSPLDLCILVCRTSGGSFPGSMATHSVRKVKPSVSCPAMLEEGEYMIVTTAFNHWGFSDSPTALHKNSFPSYVLAIHSSRAVAVEQVAMQQTCLADAIFELVTSAGKRHEGITGVTCYYMTQGISGLIVVAENRCPDHHLIIECDCSESLNVVSTRGPMNIADCIPPLHRQVLIILTQLEGTNGFAVSHKLSFHIKPHNGHGGYGAQHNPPLSKYLSGLHCARPL